MIPAKQPLSPNEPKMSHAELVSYYARQQGWIEATLFLLDQPDGLRISQLLREEFQRRYP